MEEIVPDFVNTNASVVRIRGTYNKVDVHELYNMSCNEVINPILCSWCYR